MIVFQLLLAAEEKEKKKQASKQMFRFFCKKKPATLPPAKWLMDFGRNRARVQGANLGSPLLLSLSLCSAAAAAACRPTWLDAR